MNVFLIDLFFPMLPFDPPENIRKPIVFRGDLKGKLGKKRVHNYKTNFKKFLRGSRCRVNRPIRLNDRLAKIK